MIWRISSSRPTIGSISPLRAFSVRSTENRRSASCLPICAGAMAPLASPGAAGASAEPSYAPSFSSGEPATMSPKRSPSASGPILSNSREMPRRPLRRLGVRTMPYTRWPVRTCASPNIKVA